MQPRLEDLLLRLWLRLFGGGPSKNGEAAEQNDVRITVTSRREDKPIRRAGARKPGDFYIYLHRDVDGNVFYIGKGTGDRAWRYGRSGLWQAYVERFSNSHFEVEIHEKDLSEESALNVEEELISRYSQGGACLVNRIFDPPALDKAKRDEVQQRQRQNEAQTLRNRKFEEEDLSAAVEQYQSLLSDLYVYSAIEYDPTPIGVLERHHRLGNQELLNRITICLMRLERYGEVIRVADEYESYFPRLYEGGRGEAVRRRVLRAKRKQAAK